MASNIFLLSRVLTRVLTKNVHKNFRTSLFFTFVKSAFNLFCDENLSFSRYYELSCANFENETLATFSISQSIKQTKVKSLVFTRDASIRPSTTECKHKGGLSRREDELDASASSMIKIFPFPCASDYSSAFSAYAYVTFVYALMVAFVLASLVKTRHNCY